MTFQQEVTTFSHDTSTKVVILPLLPLNGCATDVKKVFHGMKMKIKMVSQLNSLACPCGQMVSRVS